MDNTVKLISMIAGIIGGLAQTFISSKELYNFAKTNATEQNNTTSTPTATEEV